MDFTNARNRNYESIVGQKFNHLTVIDFAGLKNNRSQWLVECDCPEKTQFVTHRNNLITSNVKSCGCESRAKLTGKIFGHLLVESYSHSERQAYWNCKCLLCGKTKIANTQDLNSGHSKSCGCLVFQKNYRGFGEISGQYWSKIKANARKRKIEFDLNIEDAYEIYLKQDKRCALTGNELFLAIHYQKDHELQNASLDRINSDLPYIKENVWWVEWRVNVMKNDLSIYELVRWCKEIVNYNETGNINYDFY